jgi:hypothetical protein
MDILVCPHCGSTNGDLHYDDVEQTKFHFHCHDCNILIENTVTVNHSITDVILHKDD